MPRLLPRLIPRLLIWALTCTALLLTPLAAPPAQALTERERNQLIAGAIALGFVGLAIDQRNRKDDRRDKDRRKDKDKDKVARKAVHRAPLPAHCVYRIDSRHGPYTVLGSDCLHRSYRDARYLPRHCEQPVRYHGRHYNAYDARCLRDQGWTVARRH